MIPGRFTIPAVLVLLGLMAALMLEAAREESATMDEPIYLACGYMNWHQPGFNFNPEQPPLARLLSGLPLQAMNVAVTPPLLEIWNRQAGYPDAFLWRGGTQPVATLFPEGRQSWYFWPHWEAQVFGNNWLYGGVNDAERLLFAGRLVQIVLTLLTGVVLFLWTRQLAGNAAGLLGAALWVFNPVALAYGHLVLMDMGVTLFILLAVWAFTQYLCAPGLLNAALTGLAAGAALATKFSAMALWPLFAVLAIARWRACRKDFWQWLPVIAAAAWLVVLVVYAPFWRPAPALPSAQAIALDVPRWFQWLRPVLIPPDFFKGLALQALHATLGHEAYLSGQWQQHGWWYYFPVAIATKTPIPLLVAFAVGLLLWLRRASVETSPPWIAALVYLGLTIVSTVNIGIRYVLPLYPLFTVGAAVQLGRCGKRWQIAAWVLSVATACATFQARPFYLEYFNELAGGTARGYRVLIDSNYDWGQDAQRLQRYVAAKGNNEVYLHFFGVPQAIDYYRIPCRRVNNEDAQRLSSGTLIVSVTDLMRPEWDWLRRQHRPVDRIGYSLFVYKLGD